jgi:MerR family transcriptional regulator, thiopeptide resistance regulator
MTKKSKPAAGLTAAECARRTGLTVRALRVYERAGLLKPARSAKGWRVYGPAEFERLNIITALKGFGLTLAQIRKSFGASTPAIAAVLDLQMKTWAARRLAADRAIAQLQSAIARLQTRANLSIEELCELTRSTEMSNMQAAMRELINQHITPEQEREWLTYWAQRGPDEAQSSEEQRAMFRQIAREYHELMKRGAAPDSAEVQAVTERSTRAWLRSDMRQRQLDQLAWNPEVTRAWFSLGSKLLTRSVLPDDPAEAERLREYMNAARSASRSAKLLKPLVQEAMRLRDAGTRPQAAEARRLGERYAEICRREGFGDPRMHARWIAEFAELPEPARAGWAYLAQI